MKKLLIYLVLMTSSSFVYGEASAIDYEKIIKRAQRGMPFNGNVIVKEESKVLFQLSEGFAVREWDVTHTWESRFMIASLSKQFTAYSILLLEELGKLSVDDSISKYIDLPLGAQTDEARWKEITVHNLLTHTAGIIRDVPRTPMVSPADFNHTSHIVNASLKNANVTIKDKGDFSYSNFGYLLLASIIEKVGVTKYEAFLKKNIFFPLKMRNSGEFHRLKYISKMSAGYFYNDTRRIQKRCCNDASTFKGSHSLYSSVGDLEIWMKELHGASSILNKAVLDKMKTAQVSIEGDRHYGYGLFIDIIKGKKTIWHNGHEWGFISLMSYIPEKKMSIIYLSNTHNLDVVDGTPATFIIQQNIMEAL